MSRKTSAGPPLNQQPLDVPIAQLVMRDPVRCAPATCIRDVLLTMKNENTSSVVVCQRDNTPVGTFTLHDLLFKVALDEKDLAQPIESVMRVAPVMLPPDAPAYEAALAMARHGVRHVLVVDGPRLIRVVYERDLFSLQHASLRVISGSIRHAKSAADLDRAADDIRSFESQMREHDADAAKAGRFVATLNELISARRAEIETAATATSSPSEEHLR